MLTARSIPYMLISSYSRVKSHNTSVSRSPWRSASAPCVRTNAKFWIIHFNTLDHVPDAIMQPQLAIAPLELRRTHFNLCARKRPTPTAYADHSV